MVGLNKRLKLMSIEVTIAVKDYISAYCKAIQNDYLPYKVKVIKMRMHLGKMV